MVTTNKNKIPKTNLAFIGGSSTFAIDFPEEVKIPKVKVIGKQIFRTPFGDSPEFKLFEIDGELTLTVRMHGWRPGVKRADASRQIFWVFEQAGVKNILAEGGVGAIRRDLQLRDFIIPDDYLDFSMRKDVYLSDKYLLIMRDPVCPDLTKIIAEKCYGIFPEKKVNRGVYAVTDGRHFESPAEVRMIEKLGGDVIGQSLCPEVYLAREIVACYAGIYLVVNRAEGIKPYWSHKELKDIFYQEAMNVGRIIIEGFRQIRQGRKKDCQCSKLRKKTLLK
ncbi:MAG: MTAP family purine nucleoside phosphorylase [Nitrospira sp.]|nr:MTAP family purine nucleoside phosphorylase [Nitrospira sp.]